MNTLTFWFGMLCFGVLAGCALFKETTRTRVKDVQSSAKQTDAGSLLLKSAHKETLIFTYWNDSGFYQFQHIKEQANQATATRLNTQEKQQVKQESMAKKSEPLAAWVYTGIIIAIIGGYLVIKRSLHP